MFVDLGLPLNIYLFNQSTARFKVGLGEVRGQGEIPQLCSWWRLPPAPALLLEPRRVSCWCTVRSHGRIEAQLNSMKLAPIWEICLTKPWKLLWTCIHWFLWLESPELWWKGRLRTQVKGGYLFNIKKRRLRISGRLRLN